MTKRKLQFSIAALLALTLLVAIAVNTNIAKPKLERRTQTLDANTLLETGIRGNSLEYVLVVHGSTAIQASIAWKYPNDDERSSLQLPDGEIKRLNSKTQLYEWKNGQWNERAGTVTVEQLKTYLAGPSDAHFPLDDLLGFAENNAG